jgi:hypothetical protein
MELVFLSCGGFHNIQQIVKWQRGTTPLRKYIPLIKALEFEVGKTSLTRNR